MESFGRMDAVVNSGEGLDVGEAGLIVIAATDAGERVADALAAAQRVIKAASLVYHSL